MKASMELRHGKLMYDGSVLGARSVEASKAACALYHNVLFACPVV